MGGAVNDPIYLLAVEIWQLGYRGGVDDGICIMCNLMNVPADQREAIREYYRQLHDQEAPTREDSSSSPAPATRARGGCPGGAAGRPPQRAGGSPPGMTSPARPGAEAQRPTGALAEARAGHGSS